MDLENHICLISSHELVSNVGCVGDCGHQASKMSDFLRAPKINGCMQFLSDLQGSKVVSYMCVSPL